MNPLLKTNTLLIVSGVSGSGKSTFADFIKFYVDKSDDDCLICTADDYFYDEHGHYNFDASKLGEAHKWCQEKAFKAMNDDQKLVIVPNTNTSPKEFNPYKNYAESKGYKVVAIVMQNLSNTKSEHGVPDEVLTRQEMKLMSNIKLK